LIEQLGRRGAELRVHRQVSRSTGTRAADSAGSAGVRPPETNTVAITRVAGSRCKAAVGSSCSTASDGTPTLSARTRPSTTSRSGTTGSTDTARSTCTARYSSSPGSTRRRVRIQERDSG
jgi:hypothetical protein